MADAPDEDPELLRWLLGHHAEQMRQLGRKIETKKFQRTVAADGMGRLRTYLAGDAVTHAEKEYLGIMRHPEAWAHVMAEITEAARVPPQPQANEMMHEHHRRCVQDPIAEAVLRHNYLRMRASMTGAYGAPGTGDRPAAELWARLTVVTQEEPRLPDLGALAPGR